MSTEKIKSLLIKRQEALASKDGSLNISDSDVRSRHGLQSPVPTTRHLEIQSPVLGRKSTKAVLTPAATTAEEDDLDQVYYAGRNIRDRKHDSNPPSPAETDLEAMADQSRGRASRHPEVLGSQLVAGSERVSDKQTLDYKKTALGDNLKKGRLSEDEALDLLEELLKTPNQQTYSKAYYFLDDTISDYSEDEEHLIDKLMVQQDMVMQKVKLHGGLLPQAKLTAEKPSSSDLYKAVEATRIMGLWASLESPARPTPATQKTAEDSPSPSTGGV